MDIGIITNIIHKSGYVIWDYDSTFKENSSTIRSIVLTLNQCVGAYTYDIRLPYSYYFVSTYIEPVLNFIKENENI